MREELSNMFKSLWFFPLRWWTLQACICCSLGLWLLILCSRGFPKDIKKISLFHLGSCWYFIDGYQQSTLWPLDLVFHLSEIHTESGKLCLMNSSYHCGERFIKQGYSIITSISTLVQTLDLHRCLWIFKIHAWISGKGKGRSLEAGRWKRFWELTGR